MSFSLGKEELREHISTCVYLGIINVDWWSLPPPLSQPKKIGDDFCGLVLNQPLGGLRVIEGNPLYEDRTEGMGAVAAYTYGEHTVVFVGTRSGQLKKVRRQRGCFRMLFRLLLSYKRIVLHHKMKEPWRRSHGRKVACESGCRKGLIILYVWDVYFLTGAS